VDTRASSGSEVGAASCAGDDAASRSAGTATGADAPSRGTVQVIGRASQMTGMVDLNSCPAGTQRPESTDCVEKVGHGRSEERMIRGGAGDGNKLMPNGPRRSEYC